MVLGDDRHATKIATDAQDSMRKFFINQPREVDEIFQKRCLHDQLQVPDFWIHRIACSMSSFQIMYKVRVQTYPLLLARAK